MSRPTCPTCASEMGTIDMAVCVCPRCGTTRDAVDNIRVPQLVERCREFQLQMTVGTGLGSQYASKPLKQLWGSLGIAESINPPDRKTP